MRTLIAVALVAQANTCVARHGEGVYEYTEGPSVDEGCTEVVSENFTNASVPDDAVVGENPWVITESSEGSEKLGFLQIIDTSCSTADLIFNHRVYPGTRDKKNYSFLHEYFQNSSESRRHEETAYQFTSTADVMISESFAFTYDPASSKFNVTHTIVDDSALDYNESDEWDDQETGVFTSLMYQQSITWLRGDGEFGEGSVNLPGDADCSGSNCNLNITSACTASAPMTAHHTYAPADEFDYLSGVNQPSGF